MSKQPNPDHPVVGRLIVREPYSDTRHYETAAWYTKRVAQPQEVELRYNGSSIYAKLDAQIVDEYTASLFGGVPVTGKNPGEQNIGKDDPISFARHIESIVKQREEQGYEGGEFVLGHGENNKVELHLNEDFIKAFDFTVEQYQGMKYNPETKSYDEDVAQEREVVSIGGIRLAYYESYTTARHTAARALAAYEAKHAPQLSDDAPVAAEVAATEERDLTP